MRKAWFRRLGLAAVAGWLAVAGSAVSTAGCASERDEINRVQANYVAKNDLVGDFRNANEAPEFYVRSLIVAVQRTNPWVSDGLQDLTRRVRFEITENFLIARNAYEYVQNSDGKGGVKGKKNNGSVVAMWPITSHFNIQRSYNPATGEESNVIEENSSDVAWYDRQYMRVDWSRNMVSDPNQIFWGEAQSGELNWTPVAYFENRPGHPDASNFGEIGQGYFDVTSKWLASAATFDDDGYQVPYCLLRNMTLYPSSYSEGSIECNDQEVTLRTSFWKVPTGEKSTDYEVGEKTPWQGNIMGNLTLDRSGYDREYGVTDASWHMYMQRYNIWKKSHTSDVCGSDNNKADADAFCNGLKTDSTCDLNVKLCTIPYVERTVQPLAFYLDPELPSALEPATKRAIGEWDLALSRAVAYAREIECRHRGESRDACHVKYFDGPVDLTKEDQPKDLNTVIMCHNPVADGDHAACGQKGFKTRKGDIRHHMIAWWNNPSFNRPLGVIVWSGDPTTGENIGSTVNIFGASVETYSATARDQLQLINGDFSPAEYAAGLPRQLYSGEEFSYPTDPINDPVLDSYSQYLNKGAKAHFSPAEIAARLKAVDVAKLQKDYGADKALATATTPAEKMVAWGSYVQKMSAMGDATSKFQSPAQYVAKLSKQLESAQKGGLEPKVVNDLWASSVGIDPKNIGSKTVLDGVSPLRPGMNPTLQILANQVEEERKRARHMCSLEMPEMLSFNWQGGYAAKLKARYPDGATATGDIAKRAKVEGQKIDRVVRGKLIYQELLEPMYEFTLLHEMGHLMSMEHDFSGSWDSPNYYPEYWTYRTNAGKASAACTGPRAEGSPDNCMGPRWLDPATTDELGTTKGAEHDSIDAYAVSSVMDYKFDSLYAAKLGLMDKMAAKYIYTRTLELFDDTDKSAIPSARATGTSFLPTLTLMNSERWIVGTGYQHYTDMGRKLNLFDAKRCRPQTPDEKARGIGALGLTCAPPHKDHAFLKDMKDELPKGGFPEDFRVQYAREKGTGEGGFADPATAKSRWPYKVGDGRLSYVHQYYYDNGADFYEVTADILERYQLMYLDYFFRKGGRERDPSRAGASMVGRFFDRVQALQWNALSDVVRNGGGITTEGGDPEDQARILALTMLFDSMQAAFLRPQPGSYVAGKANGGLNPIWSSVSDDANKGSFNLGAGDSRYIDYKFDLTKQYDYQAYAFRSGTFLEKPFAGIALTDARPQLSTVARETYLDGRNVMFSFRSAIPKAFDRLVAGVFADDWDTIAPYVDPTAKADAFGMLPLTPVKLWESDATKLAAARPAGSKVVDPLLGYRVKVPAVVMMLLYQPIDSSMELVNKTRIWVPGSAEAIAVPEAEKVVYFDPIDGTEWNAKSFGTETVAGKVVDTGIGARMLQHANELMVAAYNVETEVVAGTQVKVKYGVDHRPIRIGGGALTAADIKDPAAEKKLRDYVAFLNQVRVALYYLGFGPCGYTYDRDC